MHSSILLSMEWSSSALCNIYIYSVTRISTQPLIDPLSYSHIDSIPLISNNQLLLWHHAVSIRDLPTGILNQIKKL